MTPSQEERLISALETIAKKMPDLDSIDYSLMRMADAAELQALVVMGERAEIGKDIQSEVDAKIMSLVESMINEDEDEEEEDEEGDDDDE